MGISHEQAMQIALQQARLASDLGDVPVGAVVVHDGQIISARHNEREATGDPTAHAEVNAIRDACKNLQDFSLAGCEIYTSCEPCPMCLSAIYWARLKKIYYANNRVDAAVIGFDDEFLYQEIPKPFEARMIPLEEMMRKEALQVFDSWYNNVDRIPY